MFVYRHTKGSGNIHHGQREKSWQRSGERAHEESTYSPALVSQENHTHTHVGEETSDQHNTDMAGGAAKTVDQDRWSDCSAHPVNICDVVLERRRLWKWRMCWAGMVAVLV